MADEGMASWEQILWMCFYGSIVMLLIGASILYAYNIFKGG